MKLNPIASNNSDRSAVVILALFLSILTVYGQTSGRKSSTASESSTAAIRSNDMAAVGRLIPDEGYLIRTYGAANVQSEPVDIGEGEFLQGTVIFPREQARRAQILWKNGNRAMPPESILLSGKMSGWTIGRGITLGTTLKELERLNGGPFILTGFGWDYSGTVLSWENGKLEKGFKSKVILRLAPIERALKTVSRREAASVNGDHHFRSDNKVIQKINPRIYQIIIDLK